MSFLDRVRRCQAWQPGAYRPFVIAGRQVGRVRHEFAEELRGDPEVFQVDDEAAALSDRLTDFDSRTAAVHEVLLRLRAAGRPFLWRDEDFPVVRRWGEAPLMKLERGAVPHFGVRGYGVHLNGLVERPDGLHVWVGKRAMTKATAPGKLDHLVAGGQPHGIGIRENLIKECAEEAAIPSDLARQAQPVGLVSYICERPEGLRDDVLFVYDLMLPPDFGPRNTDGEVEDFFLWPIEKAMAVVAEGEAFKFNCALCLVDLFVRRGFIGPDEADYQAVVEGLRLAPGE